MGNTEDTKKGNETAEKNPAPAWSVAVNVCRLVLALTFIFSGFVKAIDPTGTQIKIGDYLEAWGLAQAVPEWLQMIASIGLSALEFTIGVCFLFAIRRRLVSKVTLVMMAFMTILTLWIALTNPVSDCGCFGDAVKLTNWETFIKNIVLLACAIVVAARPLLMMRFISKSWQWIVLNITILFICIFAVYNLKYLPVIDFRPYHIGADIRAGMEIPQDAEQPEFETTFILEKNGVRKEFTTENYPDSTWTFIDSKTVQTKEGYVPPIHDLSMELIPEGDDITEEVLGREGYTILLISPHLEEADDTEFDEINELYELAVEKELGFYCLTASTEKAIKRWRDVTGAEYPFCLTDETTLKTMIRSNPGVMLLKQGVVAGKWSSNNIPTPDEMRELIRR